LLVTLNFSVTSSIVSTGSASDGRPHVQRVADALDEQAEVVLQRDAGQQVGRDVLGVVSGDAEDDEVGRVSLGGIDLVKQTLRGRDLRSPGLLRRKLHLPREFPDAIDAELRHVGIIDIARKMVKVELAVPHRMHGGRPVAGDARAPAGDQAHGLHARIREHARPAVQREGAMDDVEYDSEGCWMPRRADS
jgi:hypothetical protein